MTSLLNMTTRVTYKKFNSTSVLVPRLNTPVRIINHLRYLFTAIIITSLMLSFVADSVIIYKMNTVVDLGQGPGPLYFSQ